MNEWIEERIAIMMFDGGLSESYAKMKARAAWEALPK